MPHGSFSPTSVQSKGMDGASDKSARLTRLADKMVMQIVQQHKKKYPSLELDAKAVEVARHQMNLMILEGPVSDSDLRQLADRLKMAAKPIPHKATTLKSLDTPQFSDDRSRAKSESAFPQTLAQQAQVSVPSAAGSSSKTQQQMQQVMSSSFSSKNPDIHQLAQQVRALPPLVQKRLVLTHQSSPWLDFMKKDLQSYESQLKDEKIQKAMQKREQKQFLDAQVQRIVEVKKEEKEKEKKLAYEESIERSHWKDQAIESAQRKKEIVQELQHNLVGQREEALRKKREETELLKQEEAQKVEKLHQEIQKEELEKKSKKIQLRAQISKYLDFNEQMKQVSMQEKSQLLQQDIELLKAHEANLEHLEMQRKEYIRQISDRQAKKYEVADAFHKNLQKLEMLDEIKAKREAEQMEKKVQENEAAKRKRIKEENQRLKEVVQSQIKEKEEKKLNAKLESQRLKEEMTANAQMAEKKEILRRDQAKQFALQGLKEIDKQLVQLHERRFRPPAIKVGENS